VSWEREIAEIEQRRRLAAEQGGAEAVAGQHARGRLTLRERIGAFLDPDTFEELGPASGAAEYDDQGQLAGFTPANFVLGFGQVDGRRCVVGGEDFTVRGGSPNSAGLRKSVYTEQLACRYRVPLVRFHEGGGGSVAGSGSAQGGDRGPVGEPVFGAPRFASVAQALETVPVVAAALGPVAGLPAARLVASHFCVMTRHTAQVLVAGPAVVERALGEQRAKEELGGAEIHGRNGVVDSVAEDERAALAEIRRFLSFLPQHVGELAPVREANDDPERRAEMLATIVPRERRRAYDMREIIRQVFDHESFFEFRERYGQGQITGFARLVGQPVGVMANDCRFYAGAMSHDGAIKVRRFIELCETFHLPIVSLVDEPGFMIGSEAERAGTIRTGTAAVLAAATCRVPWATVIVRKVFGVAGAAHFGPDAFVLAWPSAEQGALPVEGGVAVAFRKEIEAAPDPEARRRELEEMLAARQSPFPRAESFNYHDLIDPRETRSRLCRWVAWIQPLLPSLLGSVRFGIRP
jgi:methylmalonyl-CoA decarboxylase subunit alpha